MGIAIAAGLIAAGTAAFVVGLLLLMLNPPSLSGAEDLVSLIAGAVALMVATATVTVWLTERDSMSEPEFERLVERSEVLARQPHVALEQNEFDSLVADAIDELPDEFRAALEKVPVVVSTTMSFAGERARGGVELPRQVALSVL